MKGKFTNAIFVCIISALLMPSVLKLTIFAETPGSESDPLVSKSYVDTQIKNALSNITGSTDSNSNSSSNIDKEEILEDVMAQIELLYGDKLNGNTDTGTNTDTTTDADTSSTYTPVYVTNGQILYGMEGTEIILRSGSAKTYISALDGIVNITTGENLVHDVPVTANNMLICPRGDGRGVIVTSNDAWFIVKGDYNIVN